MKRIIFRNPFITKKAKKKAESYMQLSNKAMDLAKLAAADSNFVVANNLTVFAFRYANMAARKLGFRNFVDMDTYAKRHGNSN